MKTPFSAPVYYTLITLGLISSFVTSVWLWCIATLHEGMLTSNSPMVGAAPFLTVFLIFAFSWLSYAFFSAAVAHKRAAEGCPAVRWGTSAFWFALGISLLSALYFVCSVKLAPVPEAEYIGFTVNLVHTVCSC